MRNNCYKLILLALFAIFLATCLHTGKAENSIQLINSTHKWRFSHQNIDFGTAWRAPAYDDTVAGWEGPSNILFGFETTTTEYTSPVAPIPPQFFLSMFKDPLTETPFVTNYYFRTHFTAPPAPPANLLALAKLVSTNYIDDGCIYYLNGVEMFRYNMPAGAVTATTFAVAALTEGYSATANQTIFIRTNGFTNFNWGADNVIAIEVHNATNTSSDEVFGMVLAVVIPDPVAITTQPSGTTNFLGEVSSFTLSVGATGTSPTYQWYSNNVKIASANTASFNPVISKIGGADYYVVVTNAISSATSIVTRVVIVSDTFPLILQSAFAGPPTPPGTAQSNQVLLTFNKAVQGGTPTYRSAATNLSSYTIGIFGLTNRIVITNLVAGGNRVRLTTTTDFLPGTNYTICIGNLVGTNFVPMDPNPTCIGISLLSSNIPPPLTNLFTADAFWSFNDNLGNDSLGNSLGTAWKGTNYVTDNSWGSGNAIFYFDNLGGKNGCGASASTGIQQGSTTYYFRTSFIAPAGLPSSGNLRMMHFVDDGAVVYLNGTEIYRIGMPAGIPSYATPANVTVGNPPPCTTVTVSVTNLLYKTNVMAVEVHQGGGANDTHAYFALGVDYQAAYAVLSTNTSPIAPSVSASMQNNSIVMTWTPSYGGMTWGLDSTTNFLRTGTVWAPVQDTSPYTTPKTGARKFYRLHRR